MARNKKIEVPDANDQPGPSNSRSRRNRQFINLSAPTESSHSHGNVGTFRGMSPRQSTVVPPVLNRPLHGPRRPDVVTINDEQGPSNESQGEENPDHLGMDAEERKAYREHVKRISDRYALINRRKDLRRLKEALTLDIEARKAKLKKYEAQQAEELARESRREARREAKREERRLAALAAGKELSESDDTELSSDSDNDGKEDKDASGSANSREGNADGDAGAKNGERMEAAN